MTREYHAPRGRLAAVAVALVCVAVSVTPAAAGFVCGDACPKPPTPTYPYNNFSSPVTPNQVQLTQAVYTAVSAVPTVPATPSTAQKVFVPVFSTASSVAEQFTAMTLPTMLASAVDVVNSTQASHQTAAVTLPALLALYAKTTNPGQKDSILSDMRGQALRLQKVVSGAATAASNGAQVNQALQTAMAPFLTATDTANSACGDAPGNVASLKSTLQADLAAFDACTTSACRAKYVAAVNSTLQELAAAEDLASLCSSSWGTTLRALHTGVQQFNDDVAYSLRNFFSLRETALSSAASDASQLADNFTPSSFNAATAKTLLSDVVTQLAYSMGPCYHLALTACPAMCPPSTLA